MSEQTNIDDGGPAYPCVFHDFQPHSGQQVVAQEFPGMTLRDWFAGQALAGIMTSDGRPEGDDNKAKWSYEIADAMLKARNAKQFSARVGGTCRRTCNCGSRTGTAAGNFEGGEL